MQDRHEPRGRKPNDQLPPSRAREVQRAFRLRRAEHLATLEERILILETENSQLRALLALPEADRPKIGSGPTGRGKSLKDGGVPMSERVRARKEARARERIARGLPPDARLGESDTDDDRSSHGRSPSVTTAQNTLPTANQPSNNTPGQAAPQPNATTGAIPLFSSAADLPAPYNFNLPTPFQLPISPEPHFDYNTGNLDFKAPSPNPFPIFSMFDNNNNNNNNGDQNRQNQQQQQPQPQPPQLPGINQQPTPLTADSSKPSPMSPATGAGSVSQPDLLTRLKACCHLSDSHVVNDPGLLIFATRLCQSFPCPFGGSHPDSTPSDDPEQMLLEDAWRALKATLDPGGEADGENRINTGRMAAELVVRAGASRGNGQWIVCRFKEGMTIKKQLIQGLVAGFGGKLD